MEVRKGLKGKWVSFWEKIPELESAVFAAPLDIRVAGRCVFGAGLLLGLRYLPS